MLYTQLEKSGYCAFNKIEKEKKDEKKQKKRIFNPRTIFLPAAITTGLMESGVVFVRKWSQKKPTRKKQVDDDSLRPMGFTRAQQGQQNQGVSDHEELTMTCAVALCGREDLGPQPSDKEIPTELPNKKPPDTKSSNADETKLEK